MNIYHIKRILLSLFVIAFAGCHNCHRNNENNTSKQIDYLGMNPVFYLELSKTLNKDYINKTPLVGDSLYRFKCFFVLKFFEIDSSLYYSTWVQPFFPEMNKTDEGWFFTDTTSMYYYCVNGNSLVILDYLNSQGHGLYQPNTNKEAIEVMQYAREFFKVRLGELKTPCKTYLVKGEDSIIRVSPMLPLKYENEKDYRFPSPYGKMINH
jgi:hypothetical protein